MIKQNTIPKGWKETILGEVAEKIFSGGTPDTRISKYWDGTLNWLSSGETGKKFIFDTKKKISKEGVKESSTKLADENYVVIAIAGQGNTRGQVSLLKIKSYINQSVIAIDSKKNESDNIWLFYNLSSRYSELRFVSESNSIRGSLTTQILKNLKILLPPLPEQKAIAAVLSSFDDKIELLREENKTLESIAQTIFKEWFVKFNFPCLPENYEFSGAHKPDDFDSVCTYQAVGGLPAPQKEKYFLYVLLCSDKSFYIGITENLYKRWYEHKKAQGAKWTKGKKPLKVIHWEEYTSRTEVCKREKWLKTGFGRKWLKREYNAGRLRQAGKMVNSELGEIPEGWKVGGLIEKDISDFVKTNIDIFDGEKDYIETANVDFSEFVGNFEKITYNERPSRANMQPVANSFWFARMSKSRKFLLFLNRDKLNLKTKILSTGFAGIQCIREYLYFYWNFILSNSFNDCKNQYAEGAVQVAISNSGIQRILLVIPPKNIARNFANSTEPLFEKISNNNMQIQTLSSIRDTLLPKLIKGEIRVKFNG